MNVRSEKVSVRQAAIELGVSENAVRERMRRGLYPIGVFIPKHISLKKHDRFEIYRSKLDRFLGKEHSIEDLCTNDKA